jgi:hypothetical protein
MKIFLPTRITHFISKMVFVFISSVAVILYIKQGQLNLLFYFCILFDKPTLVNDLSYISRAITSSFQHYAKMLSTVMCV